jgi:hypothetical protein
MEKYILLIIRSISTTNHEVLKLGDKNLLYDQDLSRGIRAVPARLTVCCMHLHG